MAHGQPDLADPSTSSVVLYEALQHAFVTKLGQFQTFKIQASRTARLPSITWHIDAVKYATEIR